MKTEAQKTSDRLRRRLKRYVEAAIAESWKGGGDPDNIPEINAELRFASASLKEVISELMIKAFPGEFT